jgi:hypothetical protein
MAIIPTTQRMQHRHMHGVLRAEGRAEGMGREGDDDGEEQRKGGRERCSRREEERKGSKGEGWEQEIETCQRACVNFSLSISPSLLPPSLPA